MTKYSECWINETIDYPVVGLRRCKLNKCKMKRLVKGLPVGYPAVTYEDMYFENCQFATIYISECVLNNCVEGDDMEVKKFKVGDKVKYVKEGLIDWESGDWCYKAGLVLNSIYTVEEIPNEYAIILEGRWQRLHPNHFELVEELTLEKAIDLSIRNWKHIVEDDGSDYNVKSILPELKDSPRDCGLCEYFDWGWDRQENCKPCPLRDDSRFVCCNGFHEWCQTKSKEWAQKILDKLIQIKKDRFGTSRLHDLKVAIEDAETLEALKGSIKKWEDIVNGDGEDNQASNCPLCLLYVKEREDEEKCKGCPVLDRSGFIDCKNTPMKNGESTI